MMRNIAILIVILFTISLFCASSLFSGELVVIPANFSFNLNPPGSSEQILRPTAIFYDRFFGEIFIAEQGHNRITIFDNQGNFKHEFSAGSLFTSPIDLAVDSSGFIWVLGATTDGSKIFKFDFDGLYLQTIPLPREHDSLEVRISSFCLGDNGRFILQDNSNFRVLTMDGDGYIFSAFPIMVDFEEDMRQEQKIGKIRVYNDRILIASSTIGSIYIYDLNGHMIRRVGHKGSEPGQVKFPVAAVMTDNGSVIVLDRMSHNYVCFDPNGKPVAEIGGRGDSPGWFYQPTLFELGQDGLLIIGQIYKNRVQACQLPESLLSQLSKTDRKSNRSADPIQGENSSNQGSLTKGGPTGNSETLFPFKENYFLKRTYNEVAHLSAYTNQRTTWR